MKPLMKALCSLKQQLFISSCWCISMVIILRYTPIRGQLSRVYGFQQQQLHFWSTKRRIRTSTTITTATIMKRPSFISNHGHFSTGCRHHSYLSKSQIVRPLSSLLSSSLHDPVEGTRTTLEKDDDNTVYEELKRLSMEIRRHDELYYNGNSNDNSNNNNNKDNDDSAMMISDEEYDALVQREAMLCQKHPHLLNKWQEESGWGIAATRFGGRVGIAPESAPITSSLVTVNGKSAPMRQQQQQQQQQPRRLEHLDRMLSLDNVESNEQLLAWLKRVYKKLASTSSSSSSSSNSSSDALEQQEKIITLYTEPKLDGLSLSLRYQYNDTASRSSSNDDGDDLGGFTRRTMTLQWAATRGDGRQGQDVTAAVLEGLVLQSSHDYGGGGGSGGNGSVGSIPASIEWTATTTGASSSTMTLPNILEVRGEVILPQSAFSSFLALSNHTNSTPLFSNARNAASGILLRKLISKETEHDDDDDDGNIDENKQEQISRYLRKSLRFYAYDVVMYDPKYKQGKNDNHQNSSNISDDNATMPRNGLDARKWLQAHGFQVASPVAVTQLTLNATSMLGKDGNDTKTFWTKSDIIPMLEYHDKLGQHRKNGSKDDDSLTWSWGDYEMDGCVHKVADFGLRKELGHSNRAPRWAVAHKFQSQTAITRLLDIEVQVGRTGVLTPVAVLEPVDLQGVTVQRATLHNFQHARKILLDNGDGDKQSINASRGDTLLDHVPGGCHVLIRRAGEVIPQVLQRVHNVDSSEMDNFISLSVPSKCPGCGSPTIVTGTSSASNVYREDKDLGMNTNSTISTMDATGPVLRCSASTLMCPPRATLAMAHAFSRGALDVRGLSKARIEQLMNATTADDVLGGNNRIRQPSDIFRLAQNASKLENLQQLEGWGPKSVQNLANSLNTVSTEGVSLGRFIYSLGIRNAGIHASSLIAEAYCNNVDAFLDDVQQAALVSTIKHDNDEGSCPRSFATLRQDNNLTKGIGPILLSELESFAREEDLVSAAKDLAQCIRIHSANNNNNNSIGLESRPVSQSDQEMAERPLDGMTVVFTGTIEGLSRSEAKALARKFGAKATPVTISKSTNLIVRGSQSGKKKTEQAEALGVRIMDASDFVALVNKQ